MLRFALLESVAGGEVEEGLSSLGDGGEAEAEVGELSGAEAVLEGPPKDGQAAEVAGLAASAGAAQTGAAAATPRDGHGTRHYEPPSLATDEHR